MTTTNPIEWTNPDCSTPEERQKASELHQRGYTIAEIARHIDRAHSTVWNWFNDSTCDYKIQAWKGKANDDEKLEAVDAYQRLGTIPKVCIEMDRSYDTVRRWLKEAGVDTSRKQSKSGGKKTDRLETRVAELEAENARLKEVIQLLTSN